MDGEIDEKGAPLGDSWGELARTPPRFHARVMAAFGAPQNISYLAAVLRGELPPREYHAPRPLLDVALRRLRAATGDFAATYGVGYDRLQSDEGLLRSSQRGATSLWAEVRRLNRLFLEGYLASLRERAHVYDQRRDPNSRPVAGPAMTYSDPAADYSDAGALRDGEAEDDEPYAMRMFIADSLRPPGYEHLNRPGPLYELLEDQSSWARPPRGPSRTAAQWASEGPAPGPPRAPGPSRAPGRAKEHYVVRPDTQLVEEGAGWEPGNPNRTPEMAVAEYYGDDSRVPSTTLGAAEQGREVDGDLYSWGDSWRENGGTRAFRYETIPFWQNLSRREGIDYDIEETLGTAGRELDSHVRTWDMDRVRKPDGQQYRRYGPRSGHV